MSIVSAGSNETFLYDVFVSYRQHEPERSWVRSILVPRLEREGLEVCVDYKSFRLGAALVTAMETAVVESRYTLAVLTQAYLESSFTDFERLLARHLGLEERRRRLFAVLREPCYPPLEMRAYLYLDMTEDQEFENNVVELIKECRQPPG